jgi:hypothetical protein
MRYNNAVLKYVLGRCNLQGLYYHVQVEREAVTGTPRSTTFYLSSATSIINGRGTAHNSYPLCRVTLDGGYTVFTSTGGRKTLQLPRARSGLQDHLLALEHVIRERINV